MNFEEHAAKPLLRAAGIATPDGVMAHTADEASAAASRIGPCVVKAQVPTGKRGKAGGIKLASSAQEARAAAASILGMMIGEHRVSSVLVEAQVPIAREMYAAVLNNPAAKSPLLLFSAEGGMDIEEIAAKHPDALVQLDVDIRKGVDAKALERALPAIPGLARDALVDLLLRLYSVYAASDAELVEINPLVLTKDGGLVALDCKLAMDDSGVPRHAALAGTGTPEALTQLESRGKALDLKFIELDGTVGVLANGAGLTMTTMDAVRHYGGEPANFMEIGGESYTKATPALELVLANPRVKCLLVNFCGAFARTDVMTEGVIKAWQTLKPKIPIFFTIHGTNEDEAIAMVKERLGITPFDLMDDAVKAAVQAAKGGRGVILRGSDTVLVLGITGKQGTFWSERMRDYGTRIVGGVNPKRAGEKHLDLPVWATATDASRDAKIDAAVMFIPPFGVKEAALDAIGAGIGKIVCLTEHVPVHDTMYVLAAARERGAQVIGPNTAGVVTVGECFAGFMPAFNPRVFQPGSVGVISRSGSLGTLLCLNLVQAGLGISAFVGIGGDPIIGTTTKDALIALDHHSKTKAVALVGEIGGALEEEAAEYARTMRKPIAAFIAGAASPPGKRMGHAGAIVMGDKGSYAGKKRALEAAGVSVCATPNGVAEALAPRLAPTR